ncbi:hypothetical protein C8Q72DRAFT_579994 [Fomitopsis betulina]|nr:hypothetical protein C8Q72DRAFT_579994 [Fomitopsis betulina]
MVPRSQLYVPPNRRLCRAQGCRSRYRSISWITCMMMFAPCKRAASHVRLGSRRLVSISSTASSCFARGIAYAFSRPWSQRPVRKRRSLQHWCPCQGFTFSSDEYEPPPLRPSSPNHASPPERRHIVSRLHQLERPDRDGPLGLPSSHYVVGYRSCLRLPSSEGAAPVVNPSSIQCRAPRPRGRVSAVGDAAFQHHILREDTREPQYGTCLSR